MTRYPSRRMAGSAVFLLVVLLIGVTAPVWAEEAGAGSIPAITQIPESRGAVIAAAVRRRLQFLRDRVLWHGDQADLSDHLSGR